MAHRVFYSFHYAKDAWRAGQVRNMGILEGDQPVTSNEWEEVKQKGVKNIENWIANNMKYKSCLVQLVGEETFSRRWCKYEIEHAWIEGKGIVCIYIHGLKDASGNQCDKGQNPLQQFCIDKTFNYIIEHKSPADSNEINLSKVCKAYDTPYSCSTNVYDYIYKHLDEWVEEAIAIRNQYPK